MARRTITPAMLRELRSIEFNGSPSDPVDWHHAPGVLWFHAREKVLSALIRRGLITADDGYELTDAGRTAIANATKKG